MTIQQEQHLAEQAAMLQLAGEKENEVKELKKRQKRINYFTIPTVIIRMGRSIYFSLCLQ